MITAIEITGLNNYSVDETTKKYVTKKIGRLDRYLPRHARASVSAEL
jgi:putative sigma-54 modulation protein